MNKNNYLIELSESEYTDIGRVDFVDQPQPQKVFSAIWELESQINNGGFDQYFRYVEPASIAFATSALRAIGANACAAIVQRAQTHVFGSQLPLSQDDSNERLDALGDDAQAQLNEIDQAFFAYPNNLTELLFAYVASYPETFGPIPNDTESA